MSFDTRMTPPCLDKMRTICLSISDRTSSGLTLALLRFCLRERGARAPDGRIQEALSGKRKPLHSSVPEDAGLQIDTQIGFATDTIFLIRRRSELIPLSDQNHAADRSSQRTPRAQASTLAIRLASQTPEAPRCSLATTSETLAIP